MKILFAFTILTVASLATAASEFSEIDSDKPYLTELGQFAARQMTTKEYHLKLLQVIHAEQSESTYKLKLSLQRNGDKNDLMYCTVEINAEKPEISLENYGCTLPALLRRRRPQAARVAPTESSVVTESPIVKEQPTPTTSSPVQASNEEYDILSYPYEKAIQTVKTQVGDDESSLNEIDSEPTRKPKRHIVYVRQPIRTAIPARNYFYQTRPLYQVASQPIVYRLQPQFQRYQPYYQPYFRPIAY